MAELIPYDRDFWLSNWQTHRWMIVQIRYHLLANAEDWIRRVDVPGQCMAKVSPYHTPVGWCVNLAISDPDVAFEFKMRFG